MFTVMQRVLLNPDFAAAFEDRFAHRPRRVDTFAGFIRNEVLRPTQEGKPYIVLTHWQDRSGFDAWEADRVNHGHQNPLPPEAYLGTALESYEVFTQTTETRPAALPFVVMNRIPVKPEYAQAFEERFASRAGLVDGMPGFIRNEVLRPAQEGAPYVVLTYWQNKADFERWTESEAFKQGHSRSGQLPREAFAGRNELEMHQVIQNSDIQEGAQNGSAPAQENT